MKKLTAGLLLLYFVISCSKEKPAITEKPLPITGRVNGSIKLYDRFGNENTDYSDVTIQLINKNNEVSAVAVNGDGSFRADSVLFGDIRLAVNKPGYGYMDSIGYDHEKNGDTLTSIYLIEELPFSFRLSSVGYSNSFFRFSGSYSYHSTESYMVTEFLCFSKDSTVSINHTNLLWSPSSHTNVQFITGVSGGSTSCSFKTFTDAGFANGDKIYVTLIPGITKFWYCYYNVINNYKVMHYKAANHSNVVSFTLSQ
jgi:hypothetical protein